jgi:hypothetical protein
LTSEPEYQIPVMGGRVATLKLPQPAARVDIERIKSWLDLMTDVLTANPTAESGTVLERRARAVRAVALLRAKASSSGSSALSPEEIDAEIALTRRGQSAARR